MDRNTFFLSEITVQDFLLPYNYMLMNKIGRGSYGRCYLAVASTADDYVACKVFKNTDAALEAKIHLSLNHENIVKLIQEIQVDRYNFLIMEWCPFGTLKDLLLCRSFLSDQEVRGIAKQITSGISYLHDKMIIHRDLKLKNSLIASNFAIKICDFGLSTELSHDNQKRYSFCGTPSYIAPEMAQCKSHSFPVDIWALGCIVFTLLEGHVPFGSEINCQLVEKSLRSAQHLTPSAFKFLQTILKLDPNRRPSARILLQNEYTREKHASQLNFSSFYHVPSNKNGLSKRKPLKDTTNLSEKKLQRSPQNSPVGKENNTRTQSAMTLRPRYKLPPVLEEPLEAVIFNKGRNIAKHLLGVLQKCLLLEERPSLKMKKGEKSFLCVTRWVAGLNNFGYNLSDGSFATDFGGDFIFYETLKDEIILSPIDISLNSLSEKNLKKLKRTVKLVKRNLDQLAECGPINKTIEGPIVIIARKFVRAGQGIFEPCASFLLSNGSCQVNFSNHEKILVNCKDDLVASWSPRETQIGLLSDMLRWGPPHSFKVKLEFMCYFLTTVSCLSTN